MNPRPPNILASEVHMMNSAQTGREYRITISLPYSYNRPDYKGWPFENPPTNWPVVYLLDAN